MVIQNLHLQKLNGALHGKETDKAPNHTLIIDTSKGQVYSGDEIHKGLHLQEQKKKALASEKRLKADMQTAKKDVQAKLEDKWKTIKIQHDEKVKAWKLTCETLSSEGVPKKNWPKGPV